MGERERAVDALFRYCYLHIELRNRCVRSRIMRSRLHRTLQERTKTRKEETMPTPMQNVHKLIKLFLSFVHLQRAMLKNIPIHSHRLIDSSIIIITIIWYRLSVFSSAYGKDGDGAIVFSHEHAALSWRWYFSGSANAKKRFSFSRTITYCAECTMLNSWPWEVSNNLQTHFARAETQTKKITKENE